MSELYTFFSSFLEGAMSEKHMPYAVEYIRAIVGAGGASSLAFAEMLEMAYNTVDNRKVRIVEGIDPELVVAHGAAMYARDAVLYKHLWGV